MRSAGARHRQSGDDGATIWRATFLGETVATRSLTILTLGIDRRWFAGWHTAGYLLGFLGLVSRFHLFHRGRRRGRPNNPAIIQHGRVEGLSRVSDLARQVHEIVRRWLVQEVDRQCRGACGTVKGRRPAKGSQDSGLLGYFPGGWLPPRVAPPGFPASNFSRNHQRL